MMLSRSCLHVGVLLKWRRFSDDLAHKATSETFSLQECHNRGAVHDLRSALSGSSDSLLREKVPMNFL
jgi:hypothetical protein